MLNRNGTKKYQNPYSVEFDVEPLIENNSGEIGLDREGDRHGCSWLVYK
jgi:hypothetical protein